MENAILHKNINTMFFLSCCIVCFEIIMLISFMNLKDAMQPTYRIIYFTMYVFLLLFCLCTLFLLAKRRKQVRFSNKERKLLSVGTVVFVLISMLWGAIIALLDQPSYGQVIAFIINYVCCASLLLIKPRTFIFIEIIPVAVLFVFLPFFQHNAGILPGHYINLIVLLILLTIGSIRSYNAFYNSVLAASKVKDLSERDELTGLYNRRKMNERVGSENTEFYEELQSLGILMIDVDCFKKYNDTYGHLQGDQVLNSIGTVLREAVADRDGFAARYGGEEFIVFLRNMDLKQVSDFAEEIRGKIIGLNIPHKTSEIADVITVSIGQCYKTSKLTEVYELIERADAALYQAKERGRNQIACL